jgi:hypothetical protein
VIIGISALICAACFGQVVLACMMHGRRRRFVIACMRCVLVLMMIVWILMTRAFPYELV